MRRVQADSPESCARIESRWHRPVPATLAQPDMHDTRSPCQQPATPARIGPYNAPFPRIIPPLEELPNYLNENRRIACADRASPPQEDGRPQETARMFIPSHWGACPVPSVSAAFDQGR
ncbi:protein of unknown function [Burkholderia multivorans]